MPGYETVECQRCARLVGAGIPTCPYCGDNLTKSGEKRGPETGDGRAKASAGTVAQVSPGRSSEPPGQAVESGIEPKNPDEVAEEISDGFTTAPEIPREVLDRIDRYEKLVAVSPSKVSPYILLGKAYEDGGIRERAIEVYEKLLQIDPGNNTARMRLDILHGRSTSANEAGESLMRRAPSLRVRQHAARSWRPGRILLGAAVGSLAVTAVLWVRLAYHPSFFRPVSSEMSSSSPVWSPDGSRIAVLLQNRSGDMLSSSGRFMQRTLAIVRGTKRGILEQFDMKRFGLGGGEGLSWAPDVGGLIVASWDDEGPAIYYLDLARKVKKRLVAGSAAEYSQDAKQLVFVGTGVLRGEDAGGRESDENSAGGGWRGEENLFLYDLSSGTVKKITKDGGEAPHFSPNGRRVLYEKDRVEWRKTSGEGWEDERGAKLHRDSSYPVPVGRDIHILELDTGEDRAITSEGYNTHGMWVGPEGEWVSYAYYGEGELGRGEATGGGSEEDPAREGGAGKREESADGDTREMPTFGWSGRGGGDLRVVSASGGQARTVLSANLDHVVDLENVSWDPTGHFVAFEGLVEEATNDPATQYMVGLAKALKGDEKRDIFFANADGSNKRRFENKHPYKRNPKISPDGKRIAYELVLLEIRLASFDYATEVWVDRLP